MSQGTTHRAPELAKGEKLRPRSNQATLRERIAALEKSEQRLAALNAISGLITESLQNQEALALAADEIREALDSGIIVA
ncbi:MAG: hypothetical protein FJZ95_11510, partial [Chloroflexi bacterium]|nr:hypothetical protein [Chloroflexota bacterium]